MIAGDEGKAMSILEYISDEPRDTLPFLDYLLEDVKGKMAHWAALPNDRDADKPTARESVLWHLQGFEMKLEDIKRKLLRERSES